TNGGAPAFSRASRIRSYCLSRAQRASHSGSRRARSARIGKSVLGRLRVALKSTSRRILPKEASKSRVERGGERELCSREPIVGGAGPSEGPVLKRRPW